MKEIQQLIQLEPTSFKSRVSVKIGDTYKHLNIMDIAYFQAEEKVVYAIGNQGSKHIVDLTLNELESRLDPKFFFRASRKFLVHIQSVEKAIKYFNSRLKLILKPESDEDVLVSRVTVPEFLKWMNE